MVNVQFNGQCSHFFIQLTEPPKFGCQVVATAGLELPHDVEQRPSQGDLGRPKNIEKMPNNSWFKHGLNWI